jgi:predicted ThiF/HesA family dinucleotide-utilizing enzyme
MTVGELIQFLRDIDPKTPVTINDVHDSMEYELITAIHSMDADGEVVTLYDTEVEK